MSTGIAIYDTEAREALDIGRSFFETIGFSVNSATYYRLLSDGDHIGDHDLFEVGLDRLKEMVLSGDCMPTGFITSEKARSPGIRPSAGKPGSSAVFPI